MSNQNKPQSDSYKCKCGHWCHKCKNHWDGTIGRPSIHICYGISNFSKHVFRRKEDSPTQLPPDILFDPGILF